MVRNLKPLLAQQLIRETEGRGKTYTLSPKGREELEKAARIWTSVQKELETFLGKDDAEAILRISEKLQNL